MYITDPVGIRDPEEWFVSMLTRKDYILEVHNYQDPAGASGSRWKGAIKKLLRMWSGLR